MNITNTDLYFIFFDNTVHNTSGGIEIWMNNVKYAVIRSNYSYDTFLGMFVQLSDSEISGNTVTDGYHMGINILAATNVEICNNEIYSIKGTGPVVEGGASNNHIYHNKVHP